MDTKRNSDRREVSQEFRALATLAALAKMRATKKNRKTSALPTNLIESI